MIDRQYYYLVAGLPDIQPEDSKTPFSVLDFRSELREHLHPADYRQVELLSLPVDNRNLLDVLRSGVTSIDPLGAFSLAQLEEARHEGAGLPAYMRAFSVAFRSDTPILPGMSWENQLTTLYYDHVLGITGGFLHQWLSFERDLRNLLAALSARRHRVGLEHQLIGQYRVTEAIRGSHARDFGLSGELPFVERLLQIEDQYDDLLEREREIDRLRWQVIGELNTFNYFTIETVLGFVLRLGILGRWTALDAGRGGERFRELVDGLRRQFEFPNEFSVS